MVSRGYLYPLYKGVYLVGHARAGQRARLLGALLSCGPDSFLSHRTAAALLGLRAVNVHCIEVTLVGAGGLRRPPLLVHRTRHPPVRDELRLRDGLRHSSFARVLVELAPRETEAELTRLLEEGVRRGLFFVEKVEAALERHARRPAITKLEGPLRHYVDRTNRKSWLERAFDRELARRGTLPPPQRNVLVRAGGIEWEIDCLWRAERVIVELDGRPWHICQRDIEKDKLKDMKLATLGFVPVRVTTRRFEQDTDGVFADLQALLALRRADTA